MGNYITSSEPRDDGEDEHVEVEEVTFEGPQFWLVTSSYSHPVI